MANFNIENVEVRRYLYGVVAAGIPVLMLFKLVAPDEVDVYLNLAAAVLGLGGGGLALTNTPKKGESLVITNDGK